MTTPLNPKEKVDGRKSDAQAQKSDENALPPSTSVKPIKSNTLQTDHPQQQEHGYADFYKNPEWWLVLGTFILVAFTAALALFTRRLWGATANLVIDANDTAKRQLRAYVFVKRALIEDVEKLKRPVISVEISNCGRTPAFDMIHNQYCYIAPNPTIPADLQKLSLLVASTPATLGPDVSSTKITPYGTTLTEKLYLGLASHELALYVNGKITYTDIFGKAHWTTYRLMHGRDGGPLGSDQLTFDTEGNDADRD